MIYILLSNSRSSEIDFFLYDLRRFPPIVFHDADRIDFTPFLQTFATLAPPMLVFGLISALLLGGAIAIAAQRTETK